MKGRDMRRTIWKRAALLALTLTLVMGALSACGGGGSPRKADNKVIFGDTTFNAENDEPDIDPHNGYSGWAAIRYGVGETLFRFSDSMEIQPWLATKYEHPEPNVWVFTIRSGVKFSSGRGLDAEAVRECFADLTARHARAAGDLKIADMKADGQTLTITTSAYIPTFIHYLCDPYACVIDVQAGNDGGIVAGTGPYVCTKLTTDAGLTLKKNEHYWGGEPKLDEIEVKTISDGDTLASALSSGEIDMAYGLAYSNLEDFKADDAFRVTSCETSRTFFATMNFRTPALRDPNVRKAVACAVDKKSYVKTLLNGNGTAAEGPFPDSLSYGDGMVQAAEYDPKEAKRLLKEAGWTDTDGDGFVDKDGRKLTLRWLTYPSRQELPLLADYAQSELKKIGIDVQVNCTASDADYLASGDWDIYASAMVTAPTGDPAYFFTSLCLDDSSKNRGGYHSDELEDLADELQRTSDTEKRSEVATRMTRTLLDDNGFVFYVHLRMSMVCRKEITGLKAHPSDYYEVTKDLGYES